MKVFNRKKEIPVTTIEVSKDAPEFGTAAFVLWAKGKRDEAQRVLDEGKKALKESL